MADFEFRIEGLDPVIAKLRQLPEKFANRGMRRALRKGANVWLKAARENAKRIDDPETAEMIWKNLSVQGGGRRREKQEGGPMMRVGVRGGARPLKKGTDTGLPGGNTTHWRFVELGTSQAHAQSFLRRAMDSNIESATNAVVEAAKVELDKELAKL
jgi:HK97 gp10 family phage protein